MAKHHAGDAVRIGGMTVIPVIPRIFGYTHLELIKSGGWADVFRAAGGGSSLVALKLLKADLCRSDNFRQRFEQEFDKLAELRTHKVTNVVRVLGRTWDEESNRPCIILEWVDGGSVGDRLRQPEPISLHEACQIVEGAARGAQEVHDITGGIHRDIKPDNILLDGETPKLTDLGIWKLIPSASYIADPTRTEKLTGLGEPICTWEYAAPEVRDGRESEIGVWSDVYSMGLVLYELLIRKEPTRRLGDVGSLYDTPTPVPPPSSIRREIPRELDKVCQKCLAYDPEGRYKKSRELADELRRLMAEVPGLTPESPPVKRVVPAGFSIACDAREQPSPPTMPRAWNTWRWFLVAGLGVAATGTGWQLWGRADSSSTESSALESTPQPQAHKPETRPPKTAGEASAEKQNRSYVGDVIIKVKDDDSQFLKNESLDDLEGGALKAGYQVAIIAHINPPAYLYLLWLEADGTVRPLYPWEDGDWAKRGSEEKKNRYVSEGFSQPLRNSLSGLESVLLLVRDQPLPPDADVKTAFLNLPKQEVVLRRVLRFENGELTHEGIDEQGKSIVRSGPTWAKTERERPCLEVQRVIAGNLKGLFPYTRSLCFDFQGK